MSDSKWNMNDLGEEFELNAYFLKKVARMNNVEHMNHPVLSEILKGRSKKDIDDFFEEISDINFTMLFSYGRKLATSFIDYDSFLAGGLLKEAEEELKNQGELSEKIKQLLNSIPNPDVRSSVALSVKTTADSHSENLNANEKVKKKMASWWKWLFIAIGVAAGVGVCALVALKYFTISTISVSPVCILVCSATALAIYLTVKDEKLKKIPVF